MYYPLGRVVGVSPVVVPGFVPFQGFVLLLYYILETELKYTMKLDDLQARC